MQKKISVLAIGLLLSGCMPAAIGGVTTTGYHVAQERTLGSAVDDTTIYAEIKSKYIQRDVNELFHAISVEVEEGRVLLTGSVKTPDMRVEAVRLAWQPQGVKEVINEIQVAETYSLKQYARDAYISNQVRGKLLFSKNVYSINYTIDTVNGIVYIMGIARDQDELERVTRIAKKIKGAKEVINHAQLKDDPSRQ